MSWSNRAYTGSRSTARRILAELVALGPHQRRAVADGDAHLLLIHVHVPGEVGIRNRAAAHPDDRDAIVAKIGFPCLHRVLPQVAVAGSDDRQIRARATRGFGQLEVTRHANELILGRTVSVWRLLVGGPSDVRIEVRAPGSHVDELQSGGTEDLEGLDRVVGVEVVLGRARHWLADPRRRMFWCTERRRRNSFGCRESDRALPRRDAAGARERTGSGFPGCRRTCPAGSSLPASPTADTGGTA